MRAAILTAPRSGNGYAYFNATLDSMFTKAAAFDPSHLGVFVDDSTAPVVPEGAKVQLTSPELFKAHASGWIRLTLNLCSALEWIAAGGEYGCVFEDDVLMASHWHDRTVELASEAPRKCGKEWLLTLLHFYDDLRIFSRLHQTRFGDVLMKWDRPQLFYGNQGLCFSAAAALKIASVLRPKMTLPFEQAMLWCSDRGVNAACAQEHIKLLACHPSLCKHVGLISGFGHTPPMNNTHFKE